MDCEKFDQILIDALYDELDELTLAAAKRHAEGCPRCQSAWSGLRATLKVGLLPTVEPPASLEPNILQAAREAHGRVPWPKRVGRAISWAGSYAMRPQTAMAAILVLMLGSSVIFVRRKPDRSGPSRVSVTERGVPELAAEEMRPERVGIARAPAAPLGRSTRRDEERSGSGGPYAVAPAAAAAPKEMPEGEARAGKGAEKAADSYGEAPAVAAARTRGAASQDDLGGAGEPMGAFADRAAEAKKKEEPSPSVPGGDFATAPKDAYGSAMELYNAGRYAEAERGFSDVAASGAKNAPWAAYYAAKSTENAYGCARAAAKYESVAAHYAGTSAAADAQYGAANCYKLSGNLDRAYALYSGLRSVAGYRDRAEAELGNLRILQQQVAAKASRAAPPAKPATPAAPPPNATAAPAQKSGSQQPAQ
jgi:TolA-binding protein